MSLLLGIDLGTTKTTCIAVDSESGQTVASVFQPTLGNITTSRDRAKGRSEWDARRVLQSGFECLDQISRDPAVQSQSVCSLGVTGQQHGTVLVDTDLVPLTPFINWQDQRGHELIPERRISWIEEARSRCGTDLTKRLGCQLNSGFLGTTLFWLNEQKLVPSGSRACFIMDLFVALLTGQELQTDPSVAASGGMLNVESRDWDVEALESLDLQRSQLPLIREVDQPAGTLTEKPADSILGAIPISIPIGDHQASFLGSVADRRSSLLLNVGTGAQVAVYTEKTEFSLPVELRPFPIGGHLLSNVGLTGGWSFQVVENFIRQLGGELFHADTSQPLFGKLTQLAAQADPDLQGLRCLPTFSGTRACPTQTGSFEGITPGNLTPANLIRSVLTGMAENYYGAWQQIVDITGPPDRQPAIVGAGNGLRDNAVLADAVARRFGAAVVTTTHREEAAFGAALIGGVAAGVFSSLDDAAQLIRYQPM